MKGKSALRESIESVESPSKTKKVRGAKKSLETTAFTPINQTMNNTMTSIPTQTIMHKTLKSPTRKKKGLAKGSNWAYRTNMMGERFHVVPGIHGLERASLSIELNEHPATIFEKQYPVHRHPPRLNKYAKRPSLVADNAAPN